MQQKGKFVVSRAEPIHNSPDITTSSIHPRASTENSTWTSHHTWNSVHDDVALAPRNCLTTNYASFSEVRIKNGLPNDCFAQVGCRYGRCKTQQELQYCSTVEENAVILRLIAIAAAEVVPHALQMLTVSENCHVSSKRLKTCMIRDQLCINMQHDCTEYAWVGPKSRQHLLQAMQSRGKNSKDSRKDHAFFALVM